MIANSLGAVEVASTLDDVQDMRTLHSIALSINQLRNEAMAAAARGDTARVAEDLAGVEQMRSIFRTVSARFVSRGVEGSAAQYFNAALVSIDNVVTTLRRWVTEGIQAVPGAIAAIPNAVIDGLANVLDKLIARTGQSALKLSVPIVLLVLGAVFLVSKAESTRTYRRYVA